MTVPSSGEAIVAGESDGNGSRVGDAVHGGKGFNGFSLCPQDGRKGVSELPLFCREVAVSGKKQK